MIEDRVVSLQALCDRILSNEDRRRIRSNDPRCTWIFARLSTWSEPPHQMLGGLIDAVRHVPSRVELLELLENVSDYLDYGESLTLRDEIEEILYAIGIHPEEVDRIIEQRGLLSWEEPPVSGVSLSLETRRKLLTAKGLWCPTAFAHTRRHPQLFPGSIAASQPSVRSGSELEGQSVSPGQADRLKRFFGIRHGDPVLPIPMPAPPVITSVTAPNVEEAPQQPAPSVEEAPQQPAPSVEEAPQQPAPSVEEAPQQPAPTVEEVSQKSKSTPTLDPLAKEDALSDVAPVEASESDSSQQAAEPTDITTERPPLESKVSIQSPIESEHVREIVQNAIQQNDMRLGVISISVVISKAKHAGVALTTERLVSMSERLKGVTILDDTWLGRMETVANEPRLLTEQLAAQVLSVVDQIPVDILHAQLGRNNSTYKQMTTAAVAAYFEAHPGFRVQGELVRASKGNRYTAGTELIPLELNIWRAMKSSIFPLDESAISARYTGRPKLKPLLRDRVLRSSPLFTKTDGGYFALTTSPDLYARIRAETDFISQYMEPEAELVEDDLELIEDDDETETWQVDEEIISSPDVSEEPVTEPALEVEKPRHFGETHTAPLTIREVISQVLNSDLQIPEIQRSYVWKTTQVRDLFDSLYNGYPIGTLLVWETEERLKGKRIGSTRYLDPRKGTSTRFLLDGQQRTTSIVNAIDGRGPRLYFNALDEYGSFRTSQAHLTFSARSIPVAGLDRETVESLLTKSKISQTDPAYGAIRKKLEHLIGILDRRISVETLQGFDYGEATDVFIRVNSRGTKLKNAELAIAHLAYRLPGTVGGEIQQFSDHLSKAGWDFPVPFLIRLVTAAATRKVGYTALNAVEDDVITQSWQAVREATTSWLHQLRTQLGITSEDVLVGKNSHIVPITWMATHQLEECSHRLMYWYVLSAVFNRYTGRTDSNLDQDLKFISIPDEKAMVDHLLAPLRARRSTLRVEPLEVERAGRQSALRILMYLADLHVASANLFGIDPTEDIQQPPIPTSIFATKFLKSVGFDPGDRWAKDGGLVNTIFLDPGFENDDVIKEARSLRQEGRYQHALPVISVYRSSGQVIDFLSQRSRLLVDHFNDVLSALESDQFSIRKVERPSQVSGRGRRELDHKNLPFDHTRRLMYDTIRKRVLELDPTIIEIETGTYIGFTWRDARRPFMSVARRKSVIVLTFDIKIEEMTDPRGMCRDVSSITTHGIGETGLTIRRMDEVAYALGIIEQVMDVHN